MAEIQNIFYRSGSDNFNEISDVEQSDEKFVSGPSGTKLSRTLPGSANNGKRRFVYLPVFKNSSGFKIIKNLLFIIAGIYYFNYILVLIA